MPQDPASKQAADFSSGISCESCRDALHRVVSSRVFRNAPLLRTLLTHLVESSIRRDTESLMEGVLAKQVLARPDDFDSRIDPSVRVQVGRLRSKLAEYYQGEGARDPIRLVLPRGAYMVSAEARPTGAVAEPAPGAGSHGGRPWRDYLVLAVVAIAVSAATLLAVRGSGRAPTSLREFWGPLLSGPSPPLLIFSNAEFIGASNEGMRYFRAGEDPPEAMLDTYTGVGEAMAVWEFARLFRSLGWELRVKRGRLVTWDEDRDSNIIFLGSPAENIELREVKARLRFQFKSGGQEPHRGWAGFIDRQSGDPKQYLFQITRPYREDFAMIAQVAGLRSNTRFVILAGGTTFGTQAAAEFACRPETVEELLRRIPGRSAASFPLFEALLRVRIVKGSPVDSAIVAVAATPRKF